MKRVIASVVANVLTATLLVGCVATVETRPTRAVYVASPPPSPLAEVRSGPPNPGSVWVSGYWHWNGVRYVWIPGHWEPLPTGCAWQPASYEQQDEGRWLYRPGRWARVR